jgi:DNA polymerase III subunit tau, C-terminal domain
LLAVAVDDTRQGGDPRLPLELALVKVTRPASDLSRESVAYRLERLEQGAGRAPAEPPASRGPGGTPPAAERLAEDEPQLAAEGPDVDLAQLQEAWLRSVVPAVEERGGIPAASLLREAHPTALSDDRLTVEFPATAQFHLDLAQEPKNATVLVDALYDVTGRRLAVAFALGEAGQRAAEPEGPAGEERILELLKETFDARERELETSPAKPAAPGQKTGAPPASQGE